MPGIVTTDFKELFLAYVIEGSLVRNESKDMYAVVRFGGVLQHTFGDPDENGFPEHPLFPLGLDPRAFNEIHNSPSVRALVLRNMRYRPGSEDILQTLRHWVVGFHDETLEVIGQTVEFVRTGDATSALDAINRVVRVEIR